MHFPEESAGSLITCHAIRSFPWQPAAPRLPEAQLSLPGRDIALHLAGCGACLLLAVTLGGGMFGIAGMLLFIPLVAVVYRLTAEFVRGREARRTEEEQAIDTL